MSNPKGASFPRTSVAVIGAGIIGVCTAIWLQREGHDVILIDRAGPGQGASYGNGGVLASSSIIPVTVPGLLRKAPAMLLDPRQPLFLKWSYIWNLAPWLGRYLRHCSPAHVRRIAAALAPIVSDSLAEHQAVSAGTGAEKWIVPSDYVFAYDSRTHFSRDAFAWSIRRQHGMAWEELEGSRLRDYDPVMAPTLGFAVRLPGHGRIADPGRYVQDLAAHVEAAGGKIVRARATGIACVDGRVTGVRVEGQTIACSVAVVTAGAWSRSLARSCGVDVPLESERGYHLDLWKPSHMPRSPVMIASRRFVATPMEGRLRLAGIVEFAGLDAPPSPAPFRLLARFARAAIPGLTWDEASEWMGHRPAPVDSIPIIGPAPGLKGAFLAFGHHHVGLTGGPRTGRLIAQLIAGKRPNFELAPYAASRFHWDGARS